MPSSRSQHDQDGMGGVRAGPPAVPRHVRALPRGPLTAPVGYPRGVAWPRGRCAGGGAAGRGAPRWRRCRRAAGSRPGQTRRSRTSRRPASSAASETSTFTGVPVRASIEPAWAANASGISSCDAGIASRTAMTTITGSRAATAPLTLMSAVTAAQSSIMSTTIRGRLVPALAFSCWPAQAVTPVASSLR